MPLLKEEPISLTSLVVLMPLMHLLVTSAYLFFYCMGFGANLSAFVGVDDVFTTSINAVAPIYVCLVLLVAFTFWRLSWKHPTEWERVQNIENPERRSRAARSYDTIRTGLSVGAVLGIIAALISCFDDYLRAEPMDVAVLIGPVMLLLIFWIGESGLMQRQRAIGEALSLGCYVLVATAVSGIGQGQRDRLISHTDAELSRARCGEYVVLRPISGRLLALGSDGHRALLSDECTPVLIIPNAPTRGFLGWDLLPIHLYEDAP